MPRCGMEGSAMKTLRYHHFLIAAAAVLAMSAPARANDSTAELSIGGLQFVQTNDVAMESEDLRISLDRVSVRYLFANTAGKPVTLTVAFPLPDINLADVDSVVLPADDLINFVGFETKVDGNPVKFTMDQRATVDGKDFTALLTELKLSLLPVRSPEIRLDDLPSAARSKLLTDKLVMPTGSLDQKGHEEYAAAWVTKTSAVRQQTFPPDRKTVVEHQYRPSVGSSPDTILRAPLRRSQGLASEIARYRKDYCISDAFLAELDKRAGTGEANSAVLQERRISYVLKTGANWAGPIKSFKLTIDAGAGDRLISFCTGPLKATSPNANEFTASDFKPDRDLNILIIGKF